MPSAFGTLNEAALICSCLLTLFRNSVAVQWAALEPSRWVYLEDSLARLHRLLAYLSGIFWCQVVVS